MTTYLGQLNNRVEINKRKLSSLQEYKETLLSSKENIDPELLADRLAQIDDEYAKLKKSIHANRKAEAHYNAAYNHLIDLRILDSKLQTVTDEEEKEAITREIIAHTNKLEKHLAILPQKLIDELQQQYLEYVENNPLVIDDEPEESEVEEIPMVPGSLTDNMIYQELLEIFEAEKKEFDKIKVFDTPEELEDFINKYRDLKMSCYTRLAMLNNIGKTITSEEVVEAKEEEFLMEESKEDLAPIVVMLSLVDGLEITSAPDKKLHATNVKISNTFKEELKDATWLYNVIHYTCEIANIPDVSYTEFMENVLSTEKNKNRIEIVQERIGNLSLNNLLRVYNEYFGESNNNRLTTVLKVLITEKINELA